MAASTTTAKPSTAAPTTVRTGVSGTHNVKPQTTLQTEKPKAPPAPPFRIETATTQQRYLKLMTYGNFGVGKTFLCATCVEVPSMNDVLLINAESGDLTLETSEYDFNKIDRVQCTTYRQISRIQEFLTKHCRLRDDDNIDGLREMEAWLKGVSPEEIETPRKYRTVIIDSLTEVESYCMYQLLGITDATALDAETAVAEFNEYKRNFNMIQRLVRKFRDLPMNVLMTCSRQYTQDENKRFNFTLRLTGQLSSSVQGFMDVVGFLTVAPGAEDGKSMQRRLWVQPVGKFDAKCRFSTYKDTHFDNPTIKTILTKVGLAK